MPQTTIRFTIRPDGRVEERVEGFAGSGCQQLTEHVEAALGTFGAGLSFVEERLLSPYKSFDTVLLDTVLF